MNFKDYSKKIRKEGASNVKGDTILAHITPREAAILKLLGGSGEIDPETGLPHYREVDSGGGGDGNESGSQNSGNEGRGGYGGDGRDHDGGSDNDNGNWGTGRTSSTGTSNPGNTSNYSDGNDRYDGEVNTYLNGVTTPIRTATPGYDTSVPSTTSKGNWKGALAGALLGGAFTGLPGAVKGAQLGNKIGSGKQVSGLGDTSGYNSYDSEGSTSGGSNWGGYSRDRNTSVADGNNHGEGWSRFTQGQGLSYGNGSTGTTGGTTSGTTTGTTDTTTGTTNTNPYYALYLAAYNKYKRGV